jgi:hypothetical protein
MRAAQVVSDLSRIHRFYHKEPADRKKLLVRYSVIRIFIKDRRSEASEELVFQKLLHPLDNLRRLDHDFLSRCL